jgi:6-phosphogluconate dehydrogenase (decarboxylating)
MPITVAVIGAGRMGSVIAGQLPEGTKKIIIDQEMKKARLLAERVGGTPAGSYEAVSEADLISVVIPAQDVNDAIEKLMSTAKAGALILNMATSAHIDSAVIAKNPSVTVIDAKIIGHAGAIAEGNPGIVVVKTDDQTAFNLIRNQLPGFREVVRGDTDLVSKINEMATVEAIRIAINLKKRLGSMNVPADWITVAIKTVCTGVVKAFADDDLGDFAREMVKQLEREDA